jgi:predicted metal-binding membrane protein
MVSLGGIAMLAWGTIGLRTYDMSLPTLCAHAPLRSSGPMLFDLAASLGLPAKLAMGWALMITAMMPPLILQPLRHVRDRSLARRRGYAMASFSAGYAAVWMATGAVLDLLALACRLAMPGTGVVLAGGLVIAILWQVSPAKQRCLNACHRRPSLAAFGMRAECDAFAFGFTHGTWCVGACWALMLLPLLVGQWHLPVMMAVGLFLFGERFERPAPLAWRLRGPHKALRIVVAQLRIRLEGAGLIGIGADRPLDCRNKLGFL